MLQERPRGSVLTGEAPRWGGHFLGGEAARLVPRPRVPAAWLLLAFLPKESAQRDVIGVVWYYLEGLWRIVGSGASSSLLLELIGNFFKSS